MENFILGKWYKCNFNNKCSFKYSRDRYIGENNIHDGIFYSEYIDGNGIYYEKSDFISNSLFLEKATEITAEDVELLSIIPYPINFEPTVNHSYEIF